MLSDPQTPLLLTALMRTLASVLFLMDIKSPFTVILNNGGLLAFSHFSDQQTNKEPPTHTLTRLAELVLTL